MRDAFAGDPGIHLRHTCALHTCSQTTATVDKKKLKFD